MAKLRVIVWLLFVLLCLVVLSNKLEFGYDLGTFLPPPQTDSQKVVVERLGEMPGSRFLLIGITGFSEKQLEEARKALSDSGVFLQVLSHSSRPDFSVMPNIVWRYRYLLWPDPVDAETIRSALRQRASEMALFSGSEFNALLTADPEFRSIEIIQGLVPALSTSGSWVSNDGAVILIAETRTPAFELQGQKLAVETIETILGDRKRFPSSRIEISGVGAFGVELQNVTQSEAKKRSLLASAALAFVLLVAYRRFVLLFVASIPLLTGVISGLCAVALIFPKVHGITLAFGFTLLGIAIDYPFHLFSHARSASSLLAIRRIWPTLRLGAASTLIAYIGISVSGAQGLSQLGIFTSVGLLTAALTTRWILPSMTKLNTSTNDVNSVSDIRIGANVFRWSLTAIFFVAGVGLMAFAWNSSAGTSIWNNSLASLSPVPERRLARDQEFRELLGMPNLRFVIALRKPDLQQVLEATEVLDQDLKVAVDRGLINGWKSVTSLLPSKSMQASRQLDLPDDTMLKNLLAQAVISTSFEPTAFKPFERDVGNSRRLPALDLSDFRGSVLEKFLNNHLYYSEGVWVSIVSLYQPYKIESLDSFLIAQNDDRVLVDLKSSSEKLVSDYRDYILRILTVALFAILSLLLWRLPKERALWSVANVVVVLLTTTAIVYLMTGPLTLFHIMALLLVGGLGLDYALFLGRDEITMQDRKNTHHAVMACSISTIATFGILGLSDIPALRAIGTTIAIGALLSFFIARLGVCVGKLSSN